MTKRWDPDVTLSAGDAALLLERQFPELSPVSLARFGKGWDNDAYLVNGALVFRFPRRGVAAELVVHEARELPRILGRVPVPVPDVRFLGAPAAGYPYPFAGYPLLAGTCADAVLLDDDERGALAAPIGAFLRALHDLPPAADTPPDLFARADMRRRLESLEEGLLAIRAHLPAGASPRELIERARELATARPHAGRPRLVHGDLYARHLLLDERKRLAGVIDWGDTHQGDPALDLSIAFAFLPPRARAAFFARYGEIDEDAEARARFRALYSGTALVDYGRSEGDEALVRAGAIALSLSLT